MNCYDCAVTGDRRSAVAVCVDCGAAVCAEHSVSARHWLTRSALINRVDRVDPPARVIRCGICHTAHAARGDVTAAVSAPSPTRRRQAPTPRPG